MTLISLLGRSQLRFFLRSPWSTVTVVLGVALGVTSVVAVHQVNLRVNQSLASATPVHLAGITHLLERASGQTGAAHYFALREQWRSGLLPGVSALIPIVEGQVMLGGKRTLVFATDWLAASPMQQQGLRGLSLLGRDAVIADAQTGLAEGATLSINGVLCSVVAIVDSGLGAALFADIGTGQVILARDADSLSYVGAVRRDALAWLRDALEQALPGSSAAMDLGAEWRVAGWSVRPIAAELPTVGFARSMLFNLGALGSLTLVVAWFLIYQVAVVWHRQRYPLMQRLYFLGVPRRNLRRDFVLSFIPVGLLATGIGLLVGPWLASSLSDASAPGVNPPLAGWAVTKGVLSGLGVSVLGAWMASRDAPWQPTVRWIVLSVLLLALLLGLFLESSGLLGAFVALVALCLLGILAVRPLLVRLRHSQLLGTGALLSRIGLRQVVWYPSEASVAIGALGLAVGASMGVGIMVDNFRADFARMLDQRLAHENFVTAQGRNLQAPYQWLRNAAPTVQVQRYGRARHRLGSWAVQVGYTDFTRSEAARYGMPRALLGGEALINERLARALAVAPGDVVAGVPPLRIAGVFPGFGEPGMRVLVTSETAGRMGIDTTFDRMSVSAVSERVLSDWVEKFPWLQIQSRTQMRTLALEIFDRTFSITRVLTLLSLLVAAVGMYNALLALRLNQSRSEGLLQALGLTAGERRAIALRRAVMIGAAAMLLALPLGLGMAMLLCEVVNPRAFGWSVNFSPGIIEIALPMGLALLVAVVTGSLPAPRGERNTPEVDGV
jgi:putative ABC transport system permease protein